MAIKTVILQKSDPLARAVEVIRSGGIVAYPTETFYALGVDPFNTEAVERLFRVKGRPADRPISLIIKDTCVLRTIVSELPAAAVKLTKRFWPGPLTIVVKCTERLPDTITAGTGTVGVRVSSSAVAGRLAAELSTPITATSANPSDAAPPTTAKEVLDFFGNELDLLIDGGTLPGGLPSTLLDLTGPKAVILRKGIISLEELEAKGRRR